MKTTYEEQIWKITTQSSQSILLINLSHSQSTEGMEKMAVLLVLSVNPLYAFCVELFAFPIGRSKFMSMWG